jgi:predicted kinase
MEREQILQKYIQTLPTTKTSERLFIIGFIGLTGSGKSTVAKELAKRLNLAIASNDIIRKFLRSNNLTTPENEQPMVEYISIESTKYLLENKVPHIIDADLIKFYNFAQSNAEKYGIQLFIINVVCPEEEILTRIKKTVRGSGSES